MSTQHLERSCLQVGHFQILSKDAGVFIKIATPIDENLLFRKLSHEIPAISIAVEHGTLHGMLPQVRDGANRKRFGRCFFQVRIRREVAHDPKNHRRHQDRVQQEVILFSVVGW